MAIAGHVSRRMLERYSHVRMEAKRTALEALAVSTKTAGYDTNHDTNQAAETTYRAELVENDGRPEWIRTIDLFRVKEALWTN